MFGEGRTPIYDYSYLYDEFHVSGTTLDPMQATTFVTSKAGTTTPHPPVTPALQPSNGSATPHAVPSSALLPHSLLVSRDMARLAAQNGVRVNAALAAVSAHSGTHHLR